KEKHVYRRTLVEDERAVFYLYVISAACTLYEHMKVPRRNQGGPGQNCVPVFGLADFDLAQVVKPVRKSRRKARGHMLNDHDSRGVRGHCHKNGFQSFGPPGRCTHCNNLMG